MEATISHLVPADIDSVVALLANSLPAESIDAAKFARHILLDPNFDPAGALVAKGNNQVIGFAYSAVRKTPLNDVDATRGYITAIAVDAKNQRNGIGTKLLTAVEKYIQSRGRSEVMISPYAPAYFTPGVDIAVYPAAVEFFKSHGYGEVNRPISMRCDLTKLTEPPFVSEARKSVASNGISITPFAPFLTRSILEFATREFGSDWEVVYRDTIQQILRNQSAPTRVIVAHRNGEVVAVTHHDADRFGPIGVAAAARHQRIGQILMYETLKAQRAAGHSHAYFLWSDDTTAARLYSGAGFVEARRFVILRKQLS